jgi:hypothetical protein
VRNYVSVILAKLNAVNRADAIAQARAGGRRMTVAVPIGRGGADTFGSFRKRLAPGQRPGVSLGRGGSPW